MRVFSPLQPPRHSPQQARDGCSVQGQVLARDGCHQPHADSRARCEHDDQTLTVAARCLKAVTARSQGGSNPPYQARSPGCQFPNGLPRRYSIDVRKRGRVISIFVLFYPRTYRAEPKNSYFSSPTAVPAGFSQADSRIFNSHFCTNWRCSMGFSLRSRSNRY